jgi:hypothetical protein
MKRQKRKIREEITERRAKKTKWEEMSPINAQSEREKKEKDIS